MTDKPQQTPPPRVTVYAAIALLVSGVSALIAGLLVLANKDWLRDTRVTSLNKIIKDTSKSAKDVAAAKKNSTASELQSFVDTQAKGSIIGAVVTLLLCAFLAYAVYKGRHWSRWGVIGVWVLATFTGSFVSFFVFIGFLTGGDIPAAVRIPVVVAGLGFLVTLVLTNLRPSVEYFALSRPGGARAPKQRSGLYGPRMRGPMGSPSIGKVTKQTPAARKAEVTLTKGDPSPPRGRTKARTSADAVAKGADLARTRAKAASKSRRSGT